MVTIIILYHVTMRSLYIQITHIYTHNVIIQSITGLYGPRHY